MLDKETARKLVDLVHERVSYEALLSYAEARIKRLYTLLETADTPMDIYRIQGQIKESKRILALKEEVIADLKNA